jgi:hypothetical protein
LGHDEKPLLLLGVAWAEGNSNIIPRITLDEQLLDAWIYVVAPILATTQRVRTRHRSGHRRRATHRSVSSVHLLRTFAAVLAAAGWLATACGGKISRETGCDGIDCANPPAGDAATAPTTDAAGSGCAISCAALADANCPSGYDAAGCSAKCELARLGPCGAAFDSALKCLIAHTTVKCTATGAPMFDDPAELCHASVGSYADCAASEG